jgi:light-regulated signal transduction histidine kinase (bacteriophytochrome)
MINSYVKLLERKYGDKLDEQARDYINYAVDGANKLKSMIDDLLNYSRLRKENLKSSNVKIPEILESAVKDVSEKHKDVSFKIEYDPSEFPEISADKYQISLLFSNLIDNALKFNHQPEKLVSVKMVNGSSDAVYCVSDNGIGIETEYHDKVFGVFQRLHSSSEYEGSGIGLALCRKIIENHNGDIWIESVPGKGTKIFFKLSNLN